MSPAALVFWACGLFVAMYLIPDVLMRVIGLWTTSSVEKKGGCALTFDDGPDPAFTPAILDALEEFGCRATFFVVGKKAAANPGIMERMRRGGHEIAIHGWDHRHPWVLDPVTCGVHLKRALAVIREYAHPGGRPKYRPCWGFWSLGAAIATSSMDRVMWSVPGKDWVRGATADSVALGVLQRLRDGDIVLLHDGGRYSGITVKALPEILRGMRDRGLRQLTVTELNAPD